MFKRYSRTQFCKTMTVGFILIACHDRLCRSINNVIVARVSVICFFGFYNVELKRCCNNIVLMDNKSSPLLSIVEFLTKKLLSSPNRNFSKKTGTKISIVVRENFSKFTYVQYHISATHRRPVESTYVLFLLHFEEKHIRMGILNRKLPKPSNS